MLHCWNLWLCEANYRDVERLEGIPPRPHVLTYQAPATSLTEDGPVVLPPHGRTISCACELAVQIDHEVHLADETTAAEAIRGYRVLAGFRDSSLIEEVPLPSDRDEGTGDRCGRWSDGFNCVSALIPPGEVGDPYDARMSVTIDGFEPVITEGTLIGISGGMNIPGIIWTSRQACLTSGAQRSVNLNRSISTVMRRHGGTISDTRRIFTMFAAFRPVLH